MDYLTMIKPEEIIEFTDNLSYKTDFLGDKLFPNIKSGNMKVTMRKILGETLIPIMAQVHSLDTEARIGERPSFEEITFEKLFIKEKINQTERMAEFIDSGASAGQIKNLIFDDIANLVSRVLTRVEVMKMEYLATGDVTINEDGVTKYIDYNVPLDNKIRNFATALSQKGAIGALEAVKSTAKTKGYNLQRAFCSSEFITEVISKDEGIISYFKNSNVVPTEKNIRAWLADNFGIEFVTNDDVYKTDMWSDAYRFFPKNTVSFVATRGTLGNGVFGVTPEERRLRNGKTSEKALVTTTQWINEDPVAVWTKASAIALPVPKDPNGLFICEWGEASGPQPS
jgi:hypothetical protein